MPTTLPAPDQPAVLVTGGLGKVGRAVVERLTAAGHAVRILDRADAAAGAAAIAAAGWSGASYVQGDINDHPGLVERARGCSAIVHLAAYSNPRLAGPDEVFRVNVAGTFNVFRAAEQLGIRRVVQASSINALGLLFGRCLVEPAYLPVDEDHPRPTSDSYSLSKQLAEDIAAYHARRSGISSVSLRFPWVRPRHLAGTRRAGAAVERILALDADARRRWLAGFRRGLAAVLAAGGMERDGGMAGVDEDLNALHRARGTLWTVLDERDAGLAVLRGIDAGYEGAHALAVQAAANTAGVPSAALAAAFFPDAELRRPLVGEESLISGERAQRVIGFVPEWGA